MQEKVEIFIDGSCLGNPGAGGWGVLMRYLKHEKKLSGGTRDTTNNQMELTAAIEGLNALKNPSKVHITTDSEYVKKGITEWIGNWKKRNWRTAKGQPVRNQELWRSLDEATSRHSVEWQWVKAHNGHVENEIVDDLARAEAYKIQENL